MDEIIKELREDKKRAWEMIDSLNERLSRNEKIGKDEELNKKVDKILENLAHFAESHEELKESVKSLRDEVKHVVVGVVKSEEMSRVIDTAETAVGYSELFVTDFKKIQTQMDDINMKIDNARQSLGRLEIFEGELQKLRKDIDGSNHSIQAALIEIQGVNEKINSLPHIKQQCDQINTLAESFNGKIEEIQKELAEKDQESATYKCFNANCHSELPKDLKRGKDGVTVICPNHECNVENIVEHVKNGYKWMLISCKSGRHYQQFPLDHVHREKGKCLICGNEGNILDTINWALPVNKNDKAYANKTRIINHEPVQNRKLKCWNSNCNTSFPENITLEEDKVSAVCTNIACRFINIVGSLKHGHKWMMTVCNGQRHYQQFPLATKNAERRPCQVCGEEGKAWDHNAMIAIRASE